MGIHKKLFPVSKMPWHTDYHKFGEVEDPLNVLLVDSKPEMTWDDVAKKLVPLIEELEEELKQLEPPPIDHQLGELIGTIFLVDGGRCYICGDEAVYGFRSKLYCSRCWLSVEEDFD